MAERKTIIPQKESDLEQAVAGDKIKITFDGLIGIQKIWSVFLYNENERDVLIAQERKERNEKGLNLVAVYKPLRIKNKYDKDLGLIMNNGDTKLFYADSSSKKFESYVEELKNADLWIEPAPAEVKV